MDFEDYKKALPKKVKGTKALILKTLWERGDDFPKEWVLSDEFLEMTGQKYFDRRIRELRDELGCDVETGMYEGKHAYRLVSSSLGQGNLRHYLTDAQKKKLFKSVDYVCAVCGQRFEPGLRGLQADHKIPLNRGGSHEMANWQPLCVECNVGKKKACSGCDLDCTQCPWAFPDVVGIRVLIPIKSKHCAMLTQYAKVLGKTFEECVGDAIVFYLDGWDGSDDISKSSSLTQIEEDP